MTSTHKQDSAPPLPRPGPSHGDTQLPPASPFTCRAREAHVATQPTQMINSLSKVQPLKPLLPTLGRWWLHSCGPLTEPCGRQGPGGQSGSQEHGPQHRALYTHAHTRTEPYYTHRHTRNPANSACAAGPPWRSQRWPLGFGNCTLLASQQAAHARYPCHHGRIHTLQA